MNAQKYRSVPKPNGCWSVGALRLRFRPRNNKPWFPVSATEWIDSASIDAEPVTAKAKNLEIAIPRLARNAAMIALRVPSADIAHQPHTLRRHAHELAVARDESEGRCATLVPVEAAGELVRPAVDGHRHGEEPTFPQSQSFVPPVVQASVRADSWWTR